MIKQFLIGTVVIAMTVAVQAKMYNVLSNNFESLVLFARRKLHRFANVGVVITAVLYLLMVQTINVWIWTLVYLAIGVFSELEPALYFTLIAFTTVGFGDIVLGPEWRLLSGLTAANGFLIFGWSTAYMVELVRRTA